MMNQLLREILTSRVYEVARETPLDPAPRLSQRIGNGVLLKREDLQPVFSFKIRGAYNRMARLSDTERARGVIAASAGNHAQGVAFSAKRLGLRAVIVMPRTTPEIKVDAVRAMDADVVLVGDHYAGGPALQRGTGRRERRHLRPSVRRSAGHRRAGHRGRGADESGSARPGRRVRAGRRRRTHRGHGHLHQGGAS
jgi:threonine dehydratase